LGGRKRTVNSSFLRKRGEEAEEKRKEKNPLQTGAVV